MGTACACGNDLRGPFLPQGTSLRQSTNGEDAKKKKINKTQERYRERKGRGATKRPGQKLLNKKHNLPSARSNVLPFLLAPVWQIAVKLALRRLASLPG